MSHLCLTCGQDASRAPSHVSEENLAAIVGGWGVVLTHKEALLLDCLLRHSPNVVSYDRLIQVIYPDPDSEPEDAHNVIKQYIWRLTHKFDGSTARIICTRSVGHALLAS